MHAQRSTYGSSDKRNYSQVSTMYWKTPSPPPHSLLPHSPKAELLRDKITTLRESDLSLNWVSHIFSNRDVVMNFMNKKYYRVLLLSFDTDIWWKCWRNILKRYRAPTSNSNTFSPYLPKVSIISGWRCVSYECFLSPTGIIRLLCPWLVTKFQLVLPIKSLSNLNFSVTY